ncbi:MFS transporter [Streptomyces sp. SBT349]|uniref:MFS transporter n=1 Tax=Streptomyces sp. SBT349 TaxID=1580539 RepID=UPI00066C8F14|nr:MFS transporter [Streptomyces sp. SBT349]
MTTYPGLRLLQTASFTSSLDRVMITPLLVMIAEDLGLSLASVTIVATVHLLSYGAMQMLWALLSDRYGRVPTMRLALFAAAFSSLGAAASGSLGTLVAARAASGAAFAAVIPGAMVYIGDTVAVRERQGPLTDLMRGTAVGAAVATVGAGLLADLTSWRLPFAVVGGGALLLAVFLSRLPEPTGLTPLSSRSAVLAVVRSRWAVLVLALALGEGFVMLAVLNFVPAALQAADGLSATAAGGVVACYGIGALVTAPVVKRLSAADVSRERLIAVGGPVAALSLLAFPARPGVPAMLVGCAVLGCGWAFLHSSLQTWATEVVPGARAAMVSLFATVLFLGNAAGTFAGGLVLTVADFRLLFLIFALLGVPVVVSAWLGSRRYAS